MIVAIRVDASSAIGSGHVMRCLTLAEELRAAGAHVVFVSRVLQGDLIEYVEGKSFPVIRLLDGGDRQALSLDKDASGTIIGLHERFPSGVECLVVDHYRLDSVWERSMRGIAKRIMVIDDLADRMHDCDLLLDQNWHRDMNSRYKGKLPSGCVTMLGPQYALLRSEFYESRRRVQPRSGQLRRILVFFGGSDPTNETVKALEAIIHLQLEGKLPHVALDVVVGQSNPNRDVVGKLVERVSGASLHVQVPYMARLMEEADLCLGAGGSASWERIFLGLPAITIVVADNQLELTESLAGNGLVWNLGWYSSVSVERIAKMVERAVQQPELLVEMEQSAISFMSIPERQLSLAAEWIMGGKKNAGS